MVLLSEPAMKVLSTSKAVFDEIENLVLRGWPTIVFLHSLGQQQPKTRYPISGCFTPDSTHRRERNEPLVEVMMMGQFSTGVDIPGTSIFYSVMILTSISHTNEGSDDG